MGLVDKQILVILVRWDLSLACPLKKPAGTTGWFGSAVLLVLGKWSRILAKQTVVIGPGLARFTTYRGCPVAPASFYLEPIIDLATISSFDGDCYWLVDCQGSEEGYAEINGRQIECPAHTKYRTTMSENCLFHFARFFVAHAKIVQRER